MSDNICLCYPNRIDTATVTSLAGSWDAKWPLVNVKNATLAKVARTTNTADVKIGVTLTQTRLVGVVALPNHNLSITGEWRVTVYSNPSKETLRFDSGRVKVWPRVYNSINLPWNSPNWWYGSIEEEQRQEFTHLAYCFLPDNVESSYFETEIFDSSNAEDCLEIGRIFAGQVFQPQFNPEYGKLSYGMVDNTEVVEATDGTPYFYDKRKRRKISVGLNYMDLAESFGFAYDMDRACGVKGEIIFAFSKAQQSYSYAQTFLCRNVTLSDVDFVRYNGFAKNWNLEEIV
jgi:hypothetical protein